MRWPALAMLGLGVVAGALVGRPAGLGVVLVALAVLAVAAAVAPRRDAWSVAWWALAAALAGVAALRSAGWVVWPSLLAAAALGSLAASGGAAASELTRGLARVGHLPGGWVLVARPVLSPRLGASSHQALRGGVIGAGLLAVFVPLFATADAAFAHLLGQALPSPSLDQPVQRALTWALVTCAGGALLRAGLVQPSVAAEPGAPRLARLEWAVPLAALVLLFAGFVALQLTTLYGGHDHVLSTAGLTYAEYARQGFAQLIVAAALTLAVVAGAVRWAAAAGRTDRRLLRGLLGALCALTLVVLASALTRLGLYEEAFGFTRLRLAAHVEILWLAGLLLLVLAAGATGRGAWLARGIVALSAVTVLGFALADPDRRIAERNVARFEQTGRIDTDVLAGLSPDAAPVLARLPRRLRECTLSPVRAALADGDGLASANLARTRARNALRGLSSTLGWPSDCTPR